MVLPSRTKRQADLVEHNGDMPEAGANTDADTDSGPDMAAVARNAAASLVMADLVTRAGTRLLRHFVERKILKAKYDKKTAKELIAKRTPSQKVTAIALSQMATRSVPGAAVVGAGLVASTLYRRGKARRAARRADDGKPDGGDNTPEA